MTAREEDLVARQLLEQPELIDVYLKQKRWAEVAAAVRLAHRGVPVALAQTDPALFKLLRQQITRFFLNGGRVFSLQVLERLAAEK